MAQFIAINPNVEVNGQTVLSLVNGLGAFKSEGFKILEQYGLKDVKPDGWYSQQGWLNSFKHIGENVGANTLFLIGKSIPDNAKFPPEINDIFKALSAIDVAYHMNHRLNGVVLFDPSNGMMTEGIGHYHYTKVNDKLIEIKCDNPYPCEFDKGIISQMAHRFRPSGSQIKVVHNESLGCRKKGSNACIYQVSM